MLKMLNEEDSEQEPWLTAFWKGDSDPADSARTLWAVKLPQNNYLVLLPCRF